MFNDAEDVDRTANGEAQPVHARLHNQHHRNRGLTLDGDPIEIEYELEFFSPDSEVDPDAEIVQAILIAAYEAGIDDCTGLNRGSDARFLT